MAQLLTQPHINDKIQMHVLYHFYFFLHARPCLLLRFPQTGCSTSVCALITNPPACSCVNLDGWTIHDNLTIEAGRMWDAAKLIQTGLVTQYRQRKKAEVPLYCIYDAILRCAWIWSTLYEAFLEPFVGNSHSTPGPAARSKSGWVSCSFYCWCRCASLILEWVPVNPSTTCVVTESLF